MAIGFWKGLWQIPAWARTLGRSATDFLYPPLCRLCEAELPDDGLLGSAAALCATCRTGLALTHGRACVKCGASIGPHLDPAVPCGFCRREKFVFERVIRLSVYEGLARIACLRAKQRGGEGLAASLGELLWENEPDAWQRAGIDVVVPIPHHWIHRIVRAHNASETLASVWASRLQVPLAPHILRKRRLTRPQSRLTAHDRRANLRDAFSAGSDAGLSGATVLLADDVMTTGTTVNEAAKVLIKAGTARVIVGVVARGLGRR